MHSSGLKAVKVINRHHRNIPIVDFTVTGQPLQLTIDLFADMDAGISLVLPQVRRSDQTLVRQPPC